MKKVTCKNIVGNAIPLRGDDIDTDRIIPARYLRCITFDGLGEHVLEDDRKQHPDHTFDRECYQKANILLVGRNFGCGSSREHAPQALYRWGIRGIIGQSFAEIFFSNCHAIGLPCLAVSKEGSSKLYDMVEMDPQTTLKISLESRTIEYPKGQMKAVLAEGIQKSFLAGTWDATNVLLQADDAISALKSSLPYVYPK